RLQGHVELVGDLAVRAALRSKPHDAELAGRQRFDAAAPFAARPRACHFELLSRTRGERAGAAAGGEVERLGEGLTRGRTPAAAAKGRSEFGQRVRALEQGR